MANEADQLKRSTRRTRATSFDVAELAGVSQSTVSRALAGDPVVSELTREKVKRAAEELNYSIDQNATRLRTGRTDVIAVVVICRPGELKGDMNPFYYSLLGNICSAISAAGCDALTSFQDSAANLNGYYERNRRADGLIVIGTAENTEAWAHFREVAESGANMVCWGAPYQDQNWVRSDNVAGGEIAARTLLENGYQNSVYIGSVTSLQRQYAERFEGFSRAMRSAGHTPVMVQIDPSLSRIEQGHEAVRKMIDTGMKFDGIFAACDQIALGAMQELQAQGLSIPDQVGVVGFDGINAGEHVVPPLTTIEPDLPLAAELLVKRLKAMMAGTPSDEWLVPVRLLARGSAMRAA
ncbi:LacI family transcriptional regulator [Novosphingobium kunmingense]|uniref:LacI family transcriptional regulator n=1 Tax=Novosphingobium kunmingense TaxID=1211806 RepID=A0A2N0H5F7_9SPHN|nr:LacI family DNA-binding transcriptional regulator [Novosphingobium kunmingense]PKB14144.1 LacI family transcriptional regulator [Novosphingobium kunmingense]